MLMKDALTKYNITRQAVHAKLQKQQRSIDTIRSKESGILTDYGCQWFQENYGQRKEQDSQLVDGLKQASNAMAAKLVALEADKERLEKENENLRKQIDLLNANLTTMTESMKDLTKSQLLLSGKTSTDGVVTRVKRWLFGSKPEQEEG